MLASLRHFQYPGADIACFVVGVLVVVFHRWLTRFFLAAWRSVGREPRIGERFLPWMVLLVGVGFIGMSIAIFVDQVGRP